MLGIVVKTKQTLTRRYYRVALPGSTLSAASKGICAEVSIDPPDAVRSTTTVKVPDKVSPGLAKVAIVWTSFTPGAYVLMTFSSLYKDEVS